MTTPAYKHPELKSLTEAASEIEDPQCGCGTYLDDDDLPVGACKDCVEAANRAARRVEEAEFGIDDPFHYGAGRGYPRG